MDSGMTYQKLQESMSPDLIVTDFSRRFRKGLALCMKVQDNDTVNI